MSLAGFKLIVRGTSSVKSMSGIDHFRMETIKDKYEMALTLREMYISSLSSNDNSFIPYMVTLSLSIK
jgi:hypothetical protein